MRPALAWGSILTLNSTVSSDLAGWRWALRLKAVQTNEAGEASEDAARLTLDISGPWSAPRIRAIGGGGPAATVGDPHPSR